MMPKFLVLLLSVASLGICYSQASDCETNSTITCPEGEVLNDCSTDCPSDYCACSEAQSLTACSPPIVCPSPICKCGFNQRRDSSGQCIDVRDCPPFDCSGRPNEMYNPCPFLCPTDDCLYAPFNGSCPSLFGNIGIVLYCTPKCTCAEGYWRNDDGVCIPAAECPSMQETETTTESAESPESSET